MQASVRQNLAHSHARTSRRSHRRPRIWKTLRHIFQDLRKVKQRDLRARISDPGANHRRSVTGYRILCLHVENGEPDAKRVLSRSVLSRLYLLRNHRGFEFGLAVYLVRLVAHFPISSGLETDLRKGFVQGTSDRDIHPADDCQESALLRLFDIRQHLGCD